MSVILIFFPQLSSGSFVHIFSSISHFLTSLSLLFRSVLDLKSVVSVLSKEKKIESCLETKVRSWLDQNPAVLDAVIQEEWNGSRIAREGEGSGVAREGEGREKRKSFGERRNESSLRNPVTSLLFRIMEEKKTNVCVAIDVSTSEEVLELVRMIGPHVCAVKLHVDIIEDFSFERLIQPLIQLSKEHSFLVFEDRKFADIGNTVKNQYGSGVYRIVEWAQLVTSHIVAGPGTLSALRVTAASGSAEDRGCLLLAQMSSDGNLLNSKSIARSAVSAALQNDDFVVGFICQERITTDPRFIHFTPGVSLHSHSDPLGQIYNSPQNAIHKGADVVIVGRGLTEAPDVLAMAQMYQTLSYQAYLDHCS